MTLTELAFIASEDPSQTHHWLLPEIAEMIYGGLASVLIFSLLYKFAWPAAVKGLAARTLRIQKELDGANEALQKAEADAKLIRQSLGDIEGERIRMLAEADAQAKAILAEGQLRLEREIVEIEQKAALDLEAARGRVGDELKGEIARLSSIVTTRAVSGVMSDSVQQELIEEFITNVGATK